MLQMSGHNVLNRSIALSKAASIYSRLLDGQTASEISPKEKPVQFFRNLFGLPVDRVYLEAFLGRVSKDACVGPLKKPINEVFAFGLECSTDASLDSDTAGHIFETLGIFTKVLLAKNLSGWEVMEIFAGGAQRSDAVFMMLVDLVNDGLVNTARPATIRHQALQLGLIFLCSISQLSPGAYFLRRDLFPSIASFIKSPETEQYSFEAILFLSILADFHKSDAAKLNMYLSKISDSNDQELMKKISWAANFALATSVRQYQEISEDDAAPTITASIGTFIASLRPDRALSPTPVDAVRELYKSQPIEATVILLPVYEFIRSNSVFTSIFLETLSAEDSQICPPVTIISLSSYLLTHATSTSQARAIAYASLSMDTLLVLTENDAVLTVFSRPFKQYIRLCRQRIPLLPTPPRSGRPPLCAVLDCCILWLRHNLHMRLEVQVYVKCVWACHRIIFYLQKTRVRLDYTWKELWSALLGLLHFLSSKLENLVSTGGVEQLIIETVLLLNLALSKCENFLPTPRAMHELIYELVRSSSDIQNQATVLRKLALPIPMSRRQSLAQQQPTEILNKLISTVLHYEKKITEASARTAGEAFRTIARELDASGLHGVDDSKELEAPMVRTESVLGFSRYACSDGLSLMP